MKLRKSAISRPKRRSSGAGAMAWRMKSKGVQQHRGYHARQGLFTLQQELGNDQVLRLLGMGGERDNKDTALNVAMPSHPAECEADRIAGDFTNKGTSKHIARQKLVGSAAPVADTFDKPALGAGHALAPGERQHYENRVGVNLKAARFHTGEQASTLANNLNARAFTVGQHMVFGRNEYSPGTARGEQLITHELVHVAQHSNSMVNSMGGGAPIMRTPKSESSDPTFARIQPPLFNLLGTQIPGPEVYRSAIGISATLYFGQDDFLIMDSANLQALQQLAEELRFMYKPTVIVDGHASGEGKADYNERLSELRRQTAIALLNAKANPDTSFDGKPYGELNPAVAETAQDSTELEHQRARNRRVEIVILPVPTLGAGKPINLGLTGIPPLQPNPGAFTLDEPPPLKPRTFSIAGAAEEKFDDFMNKVLKGVGIDPDTTVGGLIKLGTKAAAEKGLETALDEALDQSSLNDTAKKALKTSIKAGIQVKFEF